MFPTRSWLKGEHPEFGRLLDGGVSFSPIGMLFKDAVESMDDIWNEPFRNGEDVFFVSCSTDDSISEFDAVVVELQLVPSVMADSIRSGATDGNEYAEFAIIE
jgi:hypothetical protein